MCSDLEKNLFKPSDSKSRPRRRRSRSHHRRGAVPILDTEPHSNIEEKPKENVTDPLSDFSNHDFSSNEKKRGINENKSEGNTKQHPLKKFGEVMIQNPIKNTVSITQTITDAVIGKPLKSLNVKMKKRLAKRKTKDEETSKRGSSKKIKKGKFKSSKLFDSQDNITVADEIIERDEMSESLDTDNPFVSDKSISDIDNETEIEQNEVTPPKAPPEPKIDLKIAQEMITNSIKEYKETQQKVFETKLENLIKEFSLKHDKLKEENEVIIKSLKSELDEKNKKIQMLRSTFKAWYDVNKEIFEKKDFDVERYRTELVEFSDIIRKLNCENINVKSRTIEQKVDIEVQLQKLSELEQTVEELKLKKGRGAKEWMFLFLAYVMTLLGYLIVFFGHFVSIINLNYDIKEENFINRYIKTIEEKKLAFQSLSISRRNEEEDKNVNNQRLAIENPPNVNDKREIAKMKKRIEDEQLSVNRKIEKIIITGSKKKRVSSQQSIRKNFDQMVKKKKPYDERISKNQFSSIQTSNFESSSLSPCSNGVVIYDEKKRKMKMSEVFEEDDIISTTGSEESGEESDIDSVSEDEDDDIDQEFFEFGQ